MVEEFCGYLFIIFWSLFFTGGMFMFLGMLLVPRFVKMFGKDKCIPLRSISPLYSALAAGILAASGSAVAMASKPYLIPCSVLFGIVISSLATAFYLWKHGVKSRKVEFDVKRKYVYTVSDPERQLDAEYFTESSSWHRIIGKSGYYRHSLLLHMKDGSTLENVYVETEGFDKDRKKLITKADVPGIDVIFISSDGEKEIHSVMLSSQWTPLVYAGNSKLSLESKEWWNRWLSETYQRDGLDLVYITDLEKQLNDFETAYRGELASYPDVESNIRGLRYLARLEDDVLEVMTRVRFEKYRDKEFSKPRKKREIEYHDDICSIIVKR